MGLGCKRFGPLSLLLPWVFGDTLVRQATRRFSLLKRVLVSGVVSALLLLGLTPASGAAIRIVKIYFDSPGSDTGSNSSLNAEWIRLKNTGSRGKYLTGWTIRDASGHVYVFGTYRLGAADRVTIHTGSGSNTSAHRYWRSDWYIWNNTGDTAKLKNRAGTLIDRCSYSGAGDYKVC
jgi:hypothetical protein